MLTKDNLYGLALCGGQSTRMGSDKSRLEYYGKPQMYYLYEMLEKICEKVFISCSQIKAKEINESYNVLHDAPEFDKTGPIAALLTAFNKYPGNNFLIAGCDYPFIKEKDLIEFLNSSDEKNSANAFYNDEAKLYEPLIGWYSCKSGGLLLDLFRKKEYSLQYFLKENNAGKYIAPDARLIKSVNTPEDLKLVRDVLHTENLSEGKQEK